MAGHQDIEHEERVRILRVKADREHLDVPDDVLDYIAEHHNSSTSLKSALVYLLTMSKRRERDIDLDFARDVFGEEIEQDALTVMSAQAVVAAASAPTPDPQPVEYGRDSEPDRDAIDEPSMVGEVSEWNGSERSLEPNAGDPAAYATEWSASNDSAVQPRLDIGEEPAQAPPEVPQVEPPTAPPEAPPLVQPVDYASASDTPAKVYFTPVRTTGKRSLVARAGQLLKRAGLSSAIEEGDLVAVKLHFGEEGNTGFVHPIYLREVVARIKELGGKPFLTDSNTLYRGERSNSPDHITCAIHNGFTYATVEAPIIIADGLDGRDAEDVEIAGGHHFESVRIGSAALHADALVVVTHVKGHEATGFGGALKNVGMGLGCRSAKQRMHADFLPDPDPEKCTACGRCVKWCPVNAITIGPDRVAVVDYETCYGCGECVAACPDGAISIEWKTEPESIQEKIAEHVAGAVSGKEGKTVYLSFVTNVSPDCDCWHFSDASVVPDIGVLASTDPVAIDQAAYDLVVAAPGIAGTRGEGLGEGVDTFQRITGIDGTVAMRHAEALLLGTRNYELITLQ